MAKKIILEDSQGNVLHPKTLGECVATESGETVEGLVSKSQMFSPVIETSSAMSKVGVGNEIDVHNNVKDGAYEECVFEGRTKWIDNDTGDILDEFATDRGLSLIDVKMPILRNVGKNLFNINGDINDGDGDTRMPLNTVTGTTIISNCCTNSHYGRGQAIKCKPNTKYSIYGEIANRGMMSVHLRGKRNYYVEYPSETSTFQTFYIVTPNDCEEFILAFNTIGSTGGGVISNVIVEEGTQSTTYEPYKTNILRTSEEVVLRSLPNGVKDTYNALTGEYVKRIGEKVLCGETAEDWRDFRNTFIEKTETIDVYLINPEQKGNSNLLCDKMRTTSKGAYMNDEESISCSGGSGLNIWVSIFKNKLSTPNKEGFKQWLQSNPITVQYELAEPITTIIKPSTIPFAYQNGHVILESGSSEQSLLPHLKYSVVTGRTGQVTQNAKVLRQQENQITSLEDLLLTQIVQMDYERTLLQFDFELQAMMLG